MGVQVEFTTRDLGVDVQWGPWRNPVQQSRVKSFSAAMRRVRMLNLPLQFKMGMIRALYPLVLYGSEVSGLAHTSIHKVRVSARRALGRGAQLRRAAELELALKGGIKADPQVTLDLYTIRAWQRALLSGQQWPPSHTQWTDASKGRRGRGPLRHLKSLCDRLGWWPLPGGFGTPRGDVSWDDVDYFVVTESHRHVMEDVAKRRPDFQGIERGLDGPTLKAMRTLAAKNDHASRSVLNAACGGLWMDDRRARAFDADSTCAFCQEGEGTPRHVVFECPAFANQRKEAKVGNFLEEVPACVQTYGLG
eukprot:1108840-Amphidinium_carterae.1